jgi:hypothetical protein
MKLIVAALVIALVASAGSFAVAAQTIGANSTARSTAGGSIAGHVTDAHAKPVDTYSVVVFPTDRKVWSADSRVVKFARPAQDGGFEVTGLPPGEYWVAAVEAIQGDQGARDFAKPEVLTALSSRATRVILADHDRYMTVLRLIRR